MSTKRADGSSRIRYEPHEIPPTKLAIGLGLQLAVLNISAIVLVPMVVMRAGDATAGYLSWAVFASTAISGITTMMQATRFGRIGAGHVLVMCPGAAFIPVGIMAVSEGGPELLAVLAATSAAVPLALSWRLSLFQKILTPTVSGTVLMLIPITILPVVSELLSGSAAKGQASGVPLSFLVTFLAIGGIALLAKGNLRMWAPIIGVVAGSAVGGYFGLYDLDRVAAARWVGSPSGLPPGLDLDFGPTFWTLLPSFLLVAVISAVRTISSAQAIQHVSWRRRQAVDFRSAQGALSVDGIGNLVSGLAGTVPVVATTLSVSVTQLTGVAARRLGIIAGAAFIFLAFLPKALSSVLAVPDPVFAGYLVVLLAMIFAIGMKLAVRGGLHYQASLIVGTGFLVGTSFQYGLIFPDQVSGFAGGVFANGLNSGGFAAILMSMLLRLTEPRRARIETALDLAELPVIQEFLGDFASRHGLGRGVLDRLKAVAEEALLTLLGENGDSLLHGRKDSVGERRRRLILSAHREDGDVELSFVVGPTGENLQDRLAVLGSQATEDQPTNGDISLRVLRYLASSIRHQQYHDTDIVTVRVSTVEGQE